MAYIRFCTCAVLWSYFLAAGAGLRLAWAGQSPEPGGGPFLRPPISEAVAQQPPLQEKHPNPSGSPGSGTTLSSPTRGNTQSSAGPSTPQFSSGLGTPPPSSGASTPLFSSGLRTSQPSSGASTPQFSSGLGTPPPSGGLNPPQNSPLRPPGASGSPSPNDPAADQYALALGLYARQDWALAARELQTFLRQYPEHPQVPRAGFLLGEALLQLAQYEDALARFTEYLQKEPQGPWSAKALFRCGEAAFFAGKKEQATAFFKEFLGKYPADPMAAYVLCYLGELARKDKDWQTAAERFRKCLEQFPQNPVITECQLGLAQSLEVLQQADQALPLYQAVAQRDSGSAGAEAQFRLAALYYNLHRYPEAIQGFEQLEKRFPTSVHVGYARLYRGFALFHLKKWDEARGVFESLLREPGPQTEPGLGRPVLSQGGRDAPPQAGGSSPQGNTPGRTPGSPSSSAESASQTASLRRQAQYWFGMVQREQGQWSEAAKTFTHLAETASTPSEQVELRFYAGEAWLRSQDPAAALKEWDLALSAVGQAPARQPSPSGPHAAPPPGVPETGNPEPWLEKIWRGKVEAAVLAHDHALADRAAREFFQRWGQSALAADVARWQAQSLLERKQFEEAIRLLEPWASKAPGQELAWHIRYLLALAYQAVGRLDDAQAQLAPMIQSDSAEWKPLAQLAEASLRMAQKQYAQAVPLLEAYLKLPSSERHLPTVQAQLALCYARVRQTDKAQPLYTALAEKHSEEGWFAGLTEQLAEAALEAGDFAWSASLFSRLSNQTTDPAAVQRGLLGLGWAQYRAGQYPEASATLARVLTMNLPPAMAAEAAFLRGTILTKLQQPDAALALFEMVVDKYPETKFFGPSLVAAARVQSQLHQHAQAAQLFERYVQTFPKTEHLDAVLYDWAWSLKELGQQEASLRLFERLHREFPQSPYWAEATLRLAQQAYQTQQYERASTLVSAVLADSPRPDLRPYAIYLEVQIAASQQQWDKVPQLVEQLLKEHPGSPLQVYAEFWQVEVAMRQKDFDAGAKLLEAFVQKHSPVPAGLAPLMALRQAQLLAHQGRWDEVLQAAQQLAQQDPDFDQLYEADYLIGRALAMKARFDEAREAFQRVIRSPQGAKTETAAMAQWYIGETYFHQHDYESALRAYLQVEILYAYPEWQALALLEAARCREMLNEHPEAQQLYRRLMEQFPHSAAAQQYRKLQTPSAPNTPSSTPSAPTSSPTNSPAVSPTSSPPGMPSDQKSSQLRQKSPWGEIGYGAPGIPDTVASNLPGEDQPVRPLLMEPTTWATSLFFGTVWGFSEQTLPNFFLSV